MTHDVAAASKALKDAGWKKVGGFWQASGAKEPLRIQVVTVDAATNPQLHAAAEQVVAAWKDFGIKATLKAFPPVEFVEGQLRSGDFDAAVVEMDLGLDPDLTALLDSGQAGPWRLEHRRLSVGQDGRPPHGRPDGRSMRPRARRSSRSSRRSSWSGCRSCRSTSRIGSRWPTIALQGPTPRLISSASDRFWDVLTWRLAETPDQ